MPDARAGATPRGPIPQAEPRERIEAAEPQIVRCLSEHDPTRAIIPERFTYAFAATAEGALGARVFERDLPENTMPDVCLAFAVGAEPVGSTERFLETDSLDLTVTVDVPDPPGSPGG